MKKYGIYLAYPPVNLKSEGLGRHLAAFVKATRERGDVQFVIACPSWLHESLADLLKEYGVCLNDIDIIAPSKKAPFLFGVYRTYVQWKKTLFLKIKSLKMQTKKNPFEHRRLLSFIPIGIFIVLGKKLYTLLQHSIRGIHKILRAITQRLGLNLDAFKNLKHNPLVSKLYRFIERKELLRLHQRIAARADISAWYSPTSFWPNFNKISAPRLMCVPDIVLTEFPIGFAKIPSNHMLHNFHQVEKAVQHCDYLVTYSEAVKWHTLVERYHINPAAISVIRHGANRLDELLPENVSSIPDGFQNALHKAFCYDGMHALTHDKFAFIFYASQFRPNKNVLSLLKAYAYLRQQHNLKHKLLLTGDPSVLPEIAEFITSHQLEHDVLCLHGLSAQELAICYKLADLAINPSLSEGGFPFTFTEALSVGTPVVMARIKVTEEIITQSDLQQQMLFDPYDWFDMAQRLQWGLQHQDALLAQQIPLYHQLAQTTWRNVVDAYVDVLDRISTPSAQGTNF